jgi:hypothetical protein
MTALIERCKRGSSHSQSGSCQQGSQRHFNKAKRRRKTAVRRERKSGFEQVGFPLTPRFNAVESDPQPTKPFQPQKCV